MTDFSDYCSKLLHGNNMNVYNFSKVTGYERTAASRILKGTKKPDMEFVNAFCKYLRLSPSEEDCLHQLLEIENVGKATFDNRNFIKDLIDNLFLQNTPFFTKCEQCSVFTDYNLLNTAGETQTLNNEHDIAMFVGHVLAYEYRNNDVPTIYNDIPISYHAITSTLYNLDITFKKKARINHFILLHSNPQFQSEANYNLKVFRHFIPMYLTFYSDYNVFYSYTKNFASSKLYSAYPYSLVTSECVILFSTNLKRAIYMHNKDVAIAYINDYKSIRNNYKQLTHTSVLQDSSLCSLITHSPFKGMPSHCLDSHFCAHYATNYIGDIVDYDKLDSSTAKQLKAVLEDNRSSVALNNINMIIPADGIKRFAESGTIDLQFQYLLKSFDKKERIDILNNISNQYATNPDFKLRILKPFKYTTDIDARNNSVYIQLYESNQLILFFLQPNHRFKIISIDEVGICMAFLDFFNYLEEKNLIFTKNEAIEYLDTLCRDTENN